MAALAAPAGCSLLFNGKALLGDMSAAAEDLAGGPEDLGVDEDLAGVPPPLGDMDPTCGMPVIFNGFADAGFIDCRCGCNLDPFTGTVSTMRWSESSTGLGWQATSADGTLGLGKTGVSNGEQIALNGVWQLEGDFDLRVDYLLASVPVGGRAMLVAYGPAEMSAFVPTAIAMVYQGTGMVRAGLTVGDVTHDVGNAATGGTLRITRKGAQTCVEVVGVDNACRSVSMPRMHVYLQAQETDPACFLCGDVDVRFSNARLVTGKMVPP
jgi:hypothetical protein